MEPKIVLLSTADICYWHFLELSPSSHFPRSSSVVRDPLDRHSFSQFILFMAGATPAPPDGDRDHGPAISVPTVVLLVIATICVFTRSYVRVYMTHNFGWDDAFIILTLVPHCFFRSDAPFANP